jgi:hypothetical protein
MQIEITITKAEDQPEGYLSIYGIRNRDKESFNYICEVFHKKGACLIKNYSKGFPHIAHPAIDKSGSLKEMRQNHRWLGDKVLQIFDGFVNMDKIEITHPLDALAWWMEKNPSKDLVGKKFDLVLHNDSGPVLTLLKSFD